MHILHRRGTENNSVYIPCKSTADLKIRESFEIVTYLHYISPTQAVSFAVAIAQANQTRPVTLIIIIIIIISEEKFVIIVVFYPLIFDIERFIERLHFFEIQSFNENKIFATHPVF